MIIPDALSNSTLPFSQDLAARRPTSSKYPVPALVIGSTDTTVFTVPDDEYWEIKKISAFNRLNTPVENLEIFIVENGDSPDATNRICKQALAGFESLSLDFLSGVILAPEASLVGESDNGDVVVSGGVTRFFQGEFRD